MNSASAIFKDDLEIIEASISADLENLPGGTADFTPAATATPCALAISIALMC